MVKRLNRRLTAHLIETDDKGDLLIPRAAIWTSRRTYLEPDLFYVSAELAARQDAKHRDSADLVVVVISPGSAVYDRNKKAETYAALGVRELRLLDEAEQTVEVRRQTGKSTFDEGRTCGGGEFVESAVFPTLRLPVGQLFAD